MTPSLREMEIFVGGNRLSGYKIYRIRSIYVRIYCIIKLCLQFSNPAYPPSPPRTVVRSFVRSIDVVVLTAARVRALVTVSKPPTPLSVTMVSSFKSLLWTWMLLDSVALRCRCKNKNKELDAVRKHREAQDTKVQKVWTKKYGGLSSARELDRLPGRREKN